MVALSPAILAICLASAVATGLVCAKARIVGDFLGLVDQPDGVRKLHREATPLVGGLAVLAPSFAITLAYLSLFEFDRSLLTAVVASILIVFLGALDDKHCLSSGRRLAALALVTANAFAIDQALIVTDFHFAVSEPGIHVSLGALAPLLTLVIVVGFVNATNMADGINGQLFGSILVWSGFLLFYVEPAYALPFLVLASSALVAFAFNMSGRVFSGSAGSYAAPLFLGLSAIALYRRSGGALSAEIFVFWFYLPVVDCVRLLVSRTIRGRSPFAPDRSHFHHLLADEVGPIRGVFIYLSFLALPGAVALQSPSAAMVAFFGCLTAYVGIFLRAQVRGAAGDASGLASRRLLTGSAFEEDRSR